MLLSLNPPIRKIKQNFKYFYKRRLSAFKYQLFELNKPGDYKSRNCFDYYKCIFVHIPKTGGKSISKTLFGNFSGGHTRVTGYIKIFGEKTFNRYYKFAFVRNPWDRLFSAYHYYVYGAKKYLTDKRWIIEYEVYHKYFSHLKSFEQFVMEWLDEKNLAGPIIHFIPQHLMITTPVNRNKILVDFVGRFENIEGDFKLLCEKLNRPVLPLQHINVTSPVKNVFVKHYTNEMIDKVARLYAKDIELFRYSFPS